MGNYSKYSPLLQSYTWRYGDPASLLLELAMQPAIDGWNQADRMFRPGFRLAPRDPLIDRLGSARAIIGIAINAALFAQFLGLARVREVVAPDMLAKPFVTALAGFVVCPLAIGVFILLAAPGEKDETKRQMRWPLRTLGFGVLSSAGLAAIGLLALPGGHYIAGLSWWPLVVIFLAPPLYFLVVQLSGFVLRMVFLVAKYWFNAADGHPLLPPVVAVGVTWTAAIYDVATGGAEFLPGWLYAVTVVGTVVTVTALATLEALRVHEMYGVTFRSGPFPEEQTVCARCGRESWFAGRVCHECAPDDPSELQETLAGVAVAAIVFLGVSWWQWSPQANAGAPAAFQSPGGNVACELSSGQNGATVAKCEVREITYRTPAPRPGCAGPRYGHVMSLTAGTTAGFACAPEPVHRPGLSTLAFGKASTLGPITCHSAEDGITCRDTSGHGFRVERSFAGPAR